MNWARTAFQSIGGVCLTATLAVAQGQMGTPGAVNYVEGSVTINGHAIASKDIGSTALQPGQVLRVQQGKAEMLLTPGVFVRLGDNSTLKMVSPSLTDTRVELEQGEAMVEADQILPGNHLVIADRGADTQVLKNGLYRFTANPAQLAVYDGKAQVFIDEHAVEVGKGKELAFDQTAKLKPQSFDRKTGDNLYQWSDVRSAYVAQANQSTVQYIVDGPGSWYGMGWYWNPWFDGWAFVPGAGFWGSPFGYGFYSPAYWRYAPPAQFYTRPGVVANGRGFGGAAAGVRAGGVGGYRGSVGAGIGGFHGGMGGGFHGGGGRR